MAHIPINHPLRPVYRIAAGLTGLYVLVFGIFAIAQTGGLGAFAQDGLPWVLGLRANRAFGILSVIVGAVIVAGAVLGRNIDHWINLLGGIVFLVAGMAMMILMETDANVLGFTMATCIVSFIIGLILFTAGLYGKTGSPRAVRAEEEFRHGRGLDPQRHTPLPTPHTPLGGDADSVSDPSATRSTSEPSVAQPSASEPSASEPSASDRGATGRSRRG